MSVLSLDKRTTIETVYLGFFVALRFDEYRYDITYNSDSHLQDMLSDSNDKNFQVRVPSNGCVSDGAGTHTHQGWAVLAKVGGLGLDGVGQGGDVGLVGEL